MLNIKDLYTAVENKKILEGLSLNVKAGEVHAIMGPNGSGKSTLANVLRAGQATVSRVETLFTKARVCWK